MRWLPRLAVGLLASLSLFLPYASHAYSEWPAISTQMARASEMSGVKMVYDLRSHRGDVYFPRNLFVSLEEAGRVIKTLIAVGHYLSENTSAGPNYLIHVHFVDYVRAISVSELDAYYKRGVRTTDPRFLYEFFTRFEER